MHCLYGTAGARPGRAEAAGARRAGARSLVRPGLVQSRARPRRIRGLSLAGYDRVPAQPADAAVLPARPAQPGHVGRERARVPRPAELRPRAAPARTTPPL